MRNLNGNQYQSNNNDPNIEVLQELDALRSDLCRPDAVIDPSIISTLRKFTGLSAQMYATNSTNKQSEILKKYLMQGQSLLIENYCGYTKLCNLLLDWMKNIQDPKTINNTFIRILKKSAIELYEEFNENNENNENENENDYQKRIISQIDEITKSYGDTRVSYHGFSLFEFEDKFKNHLHKILLSKGNKMDYQRKCQRFVSYCCKNELYYLYSRRLLSQLREINAFNKLDYALSNIESKLDENIQIIINNFNNNKMKELSIYGAGIEFESELRIPYCELLRKGSFTKADISKVYNYYFQHYMNNKAINLHFLQNKQVINYLYQTLFIPSTNQKTNINKTYISQYIFLLNYALFEAEIYSKNIDKQLFDQQMQILHNLSEICRDCNYGLILSEDGEKQNILFNGIREGGIALGILIWINHCMFIKSDTYFAENFETYLTPLLVALIADIATLHVFLRHKIAVFAYNMIYNIGGQTTSTLATKSAASFDAKTTSFSSIKNMEVIKTMLDIMIYIIQLGEYSLVFEIINKRPNDLIKLDRSLHRHFITKIIQTCLAPLPKDFILSMLKLLKDKHIIAAIRNDLKTTQIVNKFVEKHKDIAHNDADVILNQINEKNKLKKNY